MKGRQFFWSMEEKSEDNDVQSTWMCVRACACLLRLTLMHARAHASSILSSVRQLHRSGTDIIGSITIEKLEEIAR